MNEDVLALEEVNPSCPQCGYRGLEYDLEFKAWVHDACGYWKDDDPSDEWFF